MLLYTALYEFICAQSPSSMKGLLIGLSFLKTKYYHQKNNHSYFLEKYHHYYSPTEMILAT